MEPGVKTRSVWVFWVRAAAITLFLVLAPGALLGVELAIADNSYSRQIFLPTVSNSSLPTPTPLPTPVETELVTNGGFEDDFTDWTISGPAILTAQNPYDGKWSVDWGGVAGTQTTNALSQSIVIPACAKTGTLWFATLYSIVPGALGDPSRENGLEWEVIDPTLGPMMAVGLAPDGSRNGLWTGYGYPAWQDVSSLDGHTVTVSVRSWIGPDNNITWSVDDVEFLVAC